VQRICVGLITPYPPIKDGIAFYAQQLSKALGSIGMKVCILTWANPSDVLTDQEKIKVINVSPPTKLGFRSSVIKALSRLSPDVVHVQYGFRRGLYGCTLGEQLLPVLFAVHRSGIPLVMTIHDIWSKSDIFARFGRNIVNIPKAIAYYAYLRSMSKFILRYVNAIIVHSDYFTNVLNSEYSVAYEKTFVIKHGVPNYQIIDSDTAKSMINTKAKYILLHFGMIWEGKKLEYLIQAMKHVVEELPDAHLIIAGPPHTINGIQYVEKLRSLSKIIGLEQYISIHSKFIKEDEVPLYFSAASLVVVPYIYSTGVSGVASLSFAFEKPVVAGLNRLRTDELGLGENARGILTPLSDPYELANAIITLLKDDELYEKLRQNVKAYKIKSSWKNVATQTSKIYKQVLQNTNFANLET